MSHYIATDLGPRQTLTTWNIRSNRAGRWVVNETRFYDNGGKVFRMPQCPQVSPDRWTAAKAVHADAVVTKRESGLPVEWAHRVA